MPIYEYRCEKCGRVSGFLVRSAGDHRPPACPKCGHAKMARAFSRFAAVSPRKGRGGGGDPVADAGPPPDAGDGADDGGAGPEPDLAGMESLLGGVDENDPRSMGRAMRKIAAQAGEPMDEEMDEVVRRLEAGEDPDKIEERIGGEGGDAGGGDDALYDG